MEVRAAKRAPFAARVRLDPRTKLLIVVVISAFMMCTRITGTAIYPRVLLAAVPFALLLTCGLFGAAALYAALLTAGVLAEAFFVFGTEGLACILITMLSGIITRFLPCVVMGYYLMATTKVSEFIAAMERLHAPRAITIPLSVMFRFFPTVREESRSINDAMKMRGVGFKSIANNPVALLEYRLVPLMMSVVRIGDELSASALTRGLGGPARRTNICRIGFTVWDAVFIGVAALASALYIVL